MVAPLAQPPRRPGELLRLQEAERGTSPFLVLRDGEGEQRVHVLEQPEGPLVIGRRLSCAVPLEWDDQVSRAHAELHRVGGEWVVADDGLSRNGTFVNGERVQGRRRLRDGDVVRVGRTHIAFRLPNPATSQLTVSPDGLGHAVILSATQRRVLAALARPCLEQRLATPATNEEIARSLHLSVEAVKSHLRVLFGKFAIGDLPQNQKRMQLARLAVEAGLVDPHARPE